MNIFGIYNQGNTCFFNATLQLLYTLMHDDIVYLNQHKLSKIKYLFDIYRDIKHTKRITNQSINILIKQYQIKDSKYQKGHAGDADEFFRQIYDLIDDSVIKSYVSCDPSKPSRYLFVNLHQYPEFTISLIKIINNDKYLLISAIRYHSNHWTSILLSRDTLGNPKYYFINDHIVNQISESYLYNLLCKDLVTVCYIKIEKSNINKLSDQNNILKNKL